MPTDHHLLSTLEVLALRDRLEVTPAVDQLAALLRLLGDPGRLRVLAVLTAHRRVGFADLAEILGLSVSAVSASMGPLYRDGIVTFGREGGRPFVELGDHPAARAVAELVRDLDGDLDDDPALPGVTVPELRPVRAGRSTTPV